MSPWIAEAPTNHHQQASATKSGDKSRAVQGRLRTAEMPEFLTNNYMGYPISIAITAGIMLLVSLVCGWSDPEDLKTEDSEGWLGKSSVAVHQIDENRIETRSSVLPLILGLVMIGIGMLLSFIIFW